MYPRTVPHLAFPQEIIDKIIEDLGGPQRISTLKTCSIVSSSFCKPAQRNIFKTVSLPLDIYEGHPHKSLNDALESNPRLGNYIESLTFMIYGPFNDIPPALLTLTHVRTITLDGDYEYVQWDLLPEACRHGIYTMFQWHSVRNLKLRFIRELPVNALCLFPTLEALRMHNTTICSSDATLSRLPGSRLPPTSANVGHLQTLKIYDTIGGAPFISAPLQSAFQDPLSSLSISHLRKLAVEVGNDVQVANFESLLENAGSSIEELKLNVYDELCHVANLRGLLKLRRITFRVTSPDVLNYISLLTETLPTSENITQISIITKQCLYSHEVVVAWQRLDEVLGGRHRTVMMRVLELAEWEVDIIYSEESARAFFEQNMPRLVSTGRLCVQSAFPGDFIFDIL